MLAIAGSVSRSKLRAIFYRSLIFTTIKRIGLSHPLLLFSNRIQSSKPTPTPFSSYFYYTSASAPFSFSRDGNYDDGTPVASVCPGCGVYMQSSDPKHPGFYIQPSLDDDKKKGKKDPILQVDRSAPIIEPEFSYSIKRGLIVEPGDTNGAPEVEQQERKEEEQARRPVVCARCHSLRHYGKVKDPKLENLLPDFDFDHTVGRKLRSASGARTVVLLVVDASDFDGSFPRKVAALLSRTIEENQSAWKEGKSGNVPRPVLVVSKIDLLPCSVSPTRLEHWVRQRAREGGLVRISRVHFVSAVRDWGIKNLAQDVAEMAGKRGLVWAVGAQNAGKSTLINAIGKAFCGKKLAFLTEAPVPGTTLGIMRVEGVLPAQAKLFDTPGLLHPHQMSTRLTREEQKLAYISKEMIPRTYRVKEGHAIHLGGLMRLDVDELSVDSIYVTIWASPYIPLHMGKTENAHKMLEDHIGRQLQPPIGEGRAEELGKWVRKEFRVSGNSWESSSMDIAASGLGWLAIGLKGEAILGVWTYDGVDVVLRNALLPQRSQNFQVTGFTVSKIVSKADKALNASQKRLSLHDGESTSSNPA